MTKIVAVAAILFLSLNLLAPFTFQPKPASAGGLGFTFTAELTFSPMSLLEKFWRVLTKQLQLRLIRIIQKAILDTFQQIATACPPYLKHRGTDVCQKVVGDWGKFFSNAVASADISLANEIGGSALPPDWRAALISALLPIDDPGVNTTYLQSGGVPPKDNTWDSFLAAFNPQRNLLGQALLTHDRLLKQQTAALQAAKSEAEPGGGVIGDKVCVEWSTGPGPFRDCLRYETVTPGKTKEEIVAKVALGEFDLITVSPSDLDAILGYLASTLLDQIFGGPGLFRATVPAPPPLPTPTPVPPPPAGLAFSANPTSIPEGGSSTLTWAAPSAGSCTASDGWSGTKPNIGSEEVRPTVTTTYTLTCNGSVRSVTVTVRPERPELP